MQTSDQAAPTGTAPPQIPRQPDNTDNTEQNHQKTEENKPEHTSQPQTEPKPTPTAIREESPQTQNMQNASPPAMSATKRNRRLFPTDPAPLEGATTTQAGPSVTGVTQVEQSGLLNHPSTGNAGIESGTELGVNLPGSLNPADATPPTVEKPETGYTTPTETSPAKKNDKQDGSPSDQHDNNDTSSKTAFQLTKAAIEEAAEAGNTNASTEIRRSPQIGELLGKRGTARRSPGPMSATRQSPKKPSPQ